MGGCTMLTQGEKRKLSSQQPNFRVGLLFLELSSSMARSAGRPKGPPRLCTHSSPSGTSLSSHTTGIEPHTNLPVWGSALPAPSHLQHYRVPTASLGNINPFPCCPAAPSTNTSRFPRGCISSDGLGLSCCEEGLGDQIKFTRGKPRYSRGTHRAPCTTPGWDLHVLQEHPEHSCALQHPRGARSSPGCHIPPPENPQHTQPEEVPRTPGCPQNSQPCSAHQYPQPWGFPAPLGDPQQHIPGTRTSGRQPVPSTGVSPPPPPERSSSSRAPAPLPSRSRRRGRWGGAPGAANAGAAPSRRAPAASAGLQRGPSGATGGGACGALRGPHRDEPAPRAAGPVRPAGPVPFRPVPAVPHRAAGLLGCSLDTAPGPGLSGCSAAPGSAARRSPGPRAGGSGSGRGGAGAGGDRPRARRDGNRPRPLAPGIPASPLSAWGGDIAVPGAARGAMCPVPVTWGRGTGHIPCHPQVTCLDYPGDGVLLLQLP